MNFAVLGLSARFVSRLDAMGMKLPTPIQTKVIPHQNRNGGPTDAQDADSNAWLHDAMQGTREDRIADMSDA